MKPMKKANNKFYEERWLFQTGYLDFRKSMVKKTEWDLLARLGPGAFETITGRVSTYDAL